MKTKQEPSFIQANLYLAKVSVGAYALPNAKFVLAPELTTDEMINMGWGSDYFGYLGRGIKELDAIREMDGEFEGVGYLSNCAGSLNFGLYEVERCTEKWITEEFLDKILSAHPEFYANVPGDLYLVDYLDAKDKSINLFHKTSVIASSPFDARKFFQQPFFDNYFNLGFNTIEGLPLESSIMTNHSILVHPYVVKETKRRY